MCATIGAGTVYRSSAPEFTPDFCGVGVVLSLTSGLVFCRSVLFSFDHCNVYPSLIYSLITFFLLTIVMSILL